jgi:hypothetical protein
MESPLSNDPNDEFKRFSAWLGEEVRKIELIFFISIFLLL